MQVEAEAVVGVTASLFQRAVSTEMPLPSLQIGVDPAGVLLPRRAELKIHLFDQVVGMLFRKHSYCIATFRDLSTIKLIGCSEATPREP